MLSFYLIDMSLLEYNMLKYPPSLLAAAAVFTAECTLNSKKNWTRTCEAHSNYSEHRLLECSKLMVSLHQKSGSGRLQSVFKNAEVDYGSYEIVTGVNVENLVFEVVSNLWLPLS
ncbi:G2/mitotic-specific cyclin-2-like protein [Tanacetum coccineum]